MRRVSPLSQPKRFRPLAVAHVGLLILFIWRKV